MLTFIVGLMLGATGAFITGGLCLVARNGNRFDITAERDEQYREQMRDLMYRRQNADIVYDGQPYSDKFVRSGTMKWN